MNTQQETHSQRGENEHETTIIVNGRQKQVTTRDLTFDQVVALAFPNPQTGPDILYTVTYKRGEGHKPEGTLEVGGSVKVKEGEIFDVTKTNRS